MVMSDVQASLEFCGFDIHGFEYSRFLNSPTHNIISLSCCSIELYQEEQNPKVGLKTRIRSKYVCKRLGLIEC